MPDTALMIPNEQVELIKGTIAKGASDTELAMFLQQCNRLGLDPFSRQIYLVPRYDSQQKKWVRSPQISIDGMRLVAQRTGKYRGQTPVEWCGSDGKWVDVWLGDEPPSGAKVGVYHADFDAPLYAVARYKSYVQEKSPMWKRMPDLMISKVAESLALRKAFPNELSGAYSNEEMQQAQRDEPPNEPKPKSLAQVVDAQVVEKSIAERFVEAMQKQTSMDELDAMWLRAEEKNMHGMNESEVKEVRIEYAKCKARLAEIIMAGGDQ